MKRNSGWDHGIRPATAEERSPYWPDDPERGPTCKYCKAGVVFIGSYTRWQGTYSRATGERHRIPKQSFRELCPVHAREWTFLHGIALPAPSKHLPIPTPSCPHCGQQHGVDETCELLRAVGPGIHQLPLHCTGCGREFLTKLSFGLQCETKMSAPLPPGGPRTSQIMGGDA